MSFALVVAFVGIGLRLAFDFEHIPNLVPIESVRNQHFDFIIIGAGTAGSVLSFELTKRSNFSVLLIEAGGIFNAFSIVPLASTLMQGTEMDWSLKTVPQKYSSRGLSDEQQSLPRGKGLGGSHQLNYLLHFSGVERDFDEWERSGADGWSYDNLKNFLNRHETNDNQCSSGETGCQDSPKLSITSLKREKSKLGDAFMRAEKEMRKAFNSNITFSLAKFTSRNGIRHSVFHEYLRKAYKHKNLSILLHAKVEKIEFNENKEAVSVIVNTKSQMSRIYASREIILSSGSFHSPQLLKLSGIGDERELTKVGINLIHHSPAVGENLFDHLNFPLFVSIDEVASVTKSKILSVSEICRFLFDGSGVLSTTAVVGTGRVEDYGIILFGMGSTDEKMLKHVANYKTEAFRAFFPLHANSSQEGFTALSTCLLPRSRGSVKLDPKNIHGSPLIDPEYLKLDYDVSCIIKSVKLTANLVSSKAFRKLNAKLHWPKLGNCANFGPFDEDSANFKPSERYLECLIRYGALTAHHPGGTCAIGSVVDSELR